MNTILKHASSSLLDCHMPTRVDIKLRIRMSR